jgi:hypothetical protein
MHRINVKNAAHNDEESGRKFWRKERSLFPSGIRTPNRPVSSLFTVPINPLKVTH